MRTFVSREHRTPEYQAAVSALFTLAEKGDHGLITRAAAEVLTDHQIETLQERGLKQSGGHVCFARLVGKRCPREYGNWSEKPDDPPCMLPGGDHDTLWNCAGKPALYLAQPYGASEKQLKEWLALAERWGLEVHIDTAPAFHFPGAVLSVWFYRKDFGPDQWKEAAAAPRVSPLPPAVLEGLNDRKLAEARGFLVATGGAKVREQWFNHCRTSGRPEILVQVARTTASLRWDVATANGDRWDVHLRPDLAEAVLARVQALRRARGGYGDSRGWLFKVDPLAAVEFAAWLAAELAKPGAWGPLTNPFADLGRKAD